MYTYFCEECDQEFGTIQAANRHQDKNPSHSIDEEYDSVEEPEYYTYDSPSFEDEDAYL